MRISGVSVDECTVTVACVEGLARASVPPISLPWPLFPSLSQLVAVQAHMQLEQSSSFAALRLLGLPEPYSLRMVLDNKSYSNAAPLGKFRE